METSTLTRTSTATPTRPFQDVYLLDCSPDAPAFRLYPECPAATQPAVRPRRSAHSLQEVLDWFEACAGPAGEDIALLCPAAVIAEVAAAALEAGARRLVLPAPAQETVVRITPAALPRLRALSM